MGFNSTATAVTSTAVTSKDFGQALSVKPLEGGSSSWIKYGGIAIDFRRTLAANYLAPSSRDEFLP
jgi:hypothetical protein